MPTASSEAVAEPHSPRGGRSRRASRAPPRAAWASATTWSPDRAVRRSAAGSVGNFVELFSRAADSALVLRNALSLAPTRVSKDGRTIRVRGHGSRRAPKLALRRALMRFMTGGKISVVRQEGYHSRHEKASKPYGDCARQPRRDRARRARPRRLRGEPKILRQSIYLPCWRALPSQAPRVRDGRRGRGCVSPLRSMKLRFTPRATETSPTLLITSAAKPAGAGGSSAQYSGHFRISRCDRRSATTDHGGCAQAGNAQVSVLRLLYG